MIKPLITVFLFLFLINCTSQKRDEEQITETVQKFWSAVRDDNEEKYLSLIDNSEGDLKLAMLDQLHFLHRNYNKINKEIEKQGIQIKNTNELGPQKAVEYTFNKPATDVIPLSVQLFFFKPQGYQTIFNVRILGNLPAWEN
ncbi:hypothetical protein ODZ84_10920 [Chryseobacterium fluminis]|uniref:hypothetical protein n=1 Tax=Chryseobacterium fluminis TaxID=2983606 RepID=UPI002252EA79|nr:hypothetical protein [Chryseobacterium sp. MMS21-Ot14]UZU00038.1 hypothetical protein ODZ84_10920 [Chryseobacterium sp. MMS21-Ot14]